MSEEIKKIVIVDDDAVILDGFKNAFKKAGFEVFAASDGEEGLKLALEKKPDIILLDIMLPQMDGLAVLEKIKQDSWGKGAHVILLTNRSDNETIAKAVQEGGFEYLLKSQWDADGVVGYVQKRLEKK